MATSVCWLLYDVAYYGSNQFTPIMTAKVFEGGVSNNPGKHILGACWKGAVDMAVGVPATLHALWLLRYWGTKKVQTYGHASIAASSLFVALLWIPLTKEDSKTNAYILFAIYLVFYYAVNWGAKMGCFVLPQEVYTNPNLKSTFTGVAAAAGKLGAVLGIWLFEALTPLVGVIAVMIIVSAFALLAAYLSHTCISDELWLQQQRHAASVVHHKILHANDADSEAIVVVENVLGQQHSQDNEEEHI